MGTSASKTVHSSFVNCLWNASHVRRARITQIQFFEWRMFWNLRFVVTAITGTCGVGRIWSQVTWRDCATLSTNEKKRMTTSLRKGYTRNRNDTVSKVKKARSHSKIHSQSEDIFEFTARLSTATAFSLSNISPSSTCHRLKSYKVVGGITPLPYVCASELRNPHCRRQGGR